MKHHVTKLTNHVTVCLSSPQKLNLFIWFFEARKILILDFFLQFCWFVNFRRPRPIWNFWIFLFTRLYFIFKVGCISPMVIWSELRIGQYKHDGYREDAPHFTIWLLKNSLIKPNWSYFTWAEMTNHHSVGSENDRFRFPVWNWNYLRIVEVVSDRDA